MLDVTPETKFNSVAVVVADTKFFEPSVATAREAVKPVPFIVAAVIDVVATRAEPDVIVVVDAIEPGATNAAGKLNTGMVGVPATTIWLDVPVIDATPRVPVTVKAEFEILHPRQ